MNWRRLTNPAFLLCVAILFGVGIALPIVVKALGFYLVKLPIQVTQTVTSIPSVAGPWEQLGRDQAYSEEIQETLGTQNYIDRIYKRDNPEPGKPPIVLQFHAAYYTGTIDTVPHVPERCMVGGGWQITSTPGRRPVKLDQSTWLVDDEATRDVRASIDANATIYSMRLGPTSKSPGSRVRLPRDADKIRLLVTEFEKQGHKMFAGYFFIANGGIATSAEDVRLLAFDRRADYAYYMKVQTSSEQAQSADELAAYTADLLNHIMPDLMLCTPDWIQVQRGDYPPDNPRKKLALSSSSATPIK
jgi:hypothetical protein